VADEHHKSPEAFLQKMDSGELDGMLDAELKKLSPEHLHELALLLLERESKARVECSADPQTKR